MSAKNVCNCIGYQWVLGPQSLDPLFIPTSAHTIQRPHYGHAYRIHMYTHVLTQTPCTCDTRTQPANGPTREFNGSNFAHEPIVQLNFDII